MSILERALQQIILEEQLSIGLYLLHKRQKTFESSHMDWT